uniref:Uncharacterized protein n=1 Tax=Arundo donax TaxID=35708 RepID=A0A0A9BEU1_ARUDO
MGTCPMLSATSGKITILYPSP